MKLANCLGNMGQRSENTIFFPSSASEFIKHGSLSVQIQMDPQKRQLSISKSHFIGAGNLSGIIIPPYRLWTLHHQAFNMYHFVVCHLKNTPFSKFLTDRWSLSFRFDGQNLPRIYIAQQLLLRWRKKSTWKLSCLLSVYNVSRMFGTIFNASLLTWGLLGSYR